LLPFLLERIDMETATETKQLAERGERVYQERLKAILEPAHVGEFVAIEPEGGGYFLGRTVSEASRAFHQAHPDRLYYLRRVGEPSAAVEIVSCQI
jgi:hypothetical protein